MKYFPLIWSGLWRKPARTAFTLLSIVVAFLLFGMLQGLSAAISDTMNGLNADRLWVMSRISMTDPLPLSYVARIRSVPGVTATAFQFWFGGYYRDPKNAVFSFAVQPESYFGLRQELHIPKEQVQAMEHTRTGAVVGIDLARKYGWKIGDKLPLPSSIWTRKDGSSNWTFDIVGIYQTSIELGQANSAVFINYDYFDEARTIAKGTVGAVGVRIENPAEAPRIGAAIDGLFANSPNETKTQTEKETAQSNLKQVGDIDFITRRIIFAVFFTLLFLTGNTMMQSIRERIPEIAVLKTLGFSDEGVVALVIAEAVLLCELAAFAGLAAAALCFPAMKSMGIGMPHLALSVIELGAAAALGLALLVGLPPAWRALRLNIVDALAGR